MNTTGLQLLFLLLLGGATSYFYKKEFHIWPEITASHYLDITMYIINTKC